MKDCCGGIILSWGCNVTDKIFHLAQAYAFIKISFALRELGPSLSRFQPLNLAHRGRETKVKAPPLFRFRFRSRRACLLGVSMYPIAEGGRVAG